MVCYHPRQGYRSREGRNPLSGKWKIVFNSVEGYPDLPETVPCGQCIGCRLEKSRQWAVRCVHEAQMYEKNCFITLTFNDENLNPQGTLVKRDFQLFMKRLRKRFPNDRIRYYHCGEYGTSMQRPHHHAILFNFDFPDKVLWQVRQKIPLYRSAILEDLWEYGFSTVGQATFESAAYVARYILKKVTGGRAAAHYGGRLPEYTTMSLKPGIARVWYNRYKTDVYPHDYVVVRGGRKCRPPRYYDSIYDVENPEKFKKIKLNRARKSLDSLMRDLVFSLVQKKVKDICMKGFDGMSGSGLDRISRGVDRMIAFYSRTSPQSYVRLEQMEKAKELQIRRLIRSVH